MSKEFKDLLRYDVLQRAIEFMIAEVIISLIIATLVKLQIIPPTSSGMLVLGVGLLIYIIIIAKNCFEYFWMVNERKIYFLSSFLAYMPVIVLSLILRYCPFAAYTWMFFLYKTFMILPIGTTGANLLTHLLILSVTTFIGLFFIPTPRNEAWEEE